jgi:hypothetical protein
MKSEVEAKNLRILLVGRCLLQGELKGVESSSSDQREGLKNRHDFRKYVLEGV